MRHLGVDVSRYSHSKRMSTDSSYAIQKLLAGRTVKTVFDVGANIGQSAETYRKFFQHATVHSFEPADETYRELLQSCHHDARIKPWKLAVSDEIGTKEFFVNDDQTTSSLLAPSENVHNASLKQKLRSTGRVSVECITLDAFCQEHSIANIDLLKLDIQGAELQALCGAANLLGSGSIGVVFCEVLFSPLYQNACDFGLISAAMKGHGYVLYGLYNTYHFESDGLLWGDAIYVHPSVLAEVKTPQR